MADHRVADVVGKVALTLDGGGFKSVAAQSGIISGLLAANSLKNGGRISTGMLASRLLERIETVSSVSGGSWFACELIYSPRFRELIESMAFDPITAGSQFDQDWIDGWLSIAENNPVFIRLLASLAGLANNPVLQQTLIEIGFFLKDGFTWQNFTGTLLERTASLDPSIPLGSDVQRWAEGKAWLIGNSVALPTGLNGLDKVVIFPPGAEDPVSKCNFATYVAKHEHESAESTFPGFVPAAFSVKLGAGPGSSSVVPYVAHEALPADVKLAFNGGGPKSGFFGCCCPQKFSQNSSALGHFENLSFFAGSLPVGDAVACSSAFLGDIATLPSVEDSNAFAELAMRVNGDLSTWAGSATHAKGLSGAFDAVNNIYSAKRVREESFDTLVSQSLRCTIDGGFTDATGIANAVGAGATDLVAILNMTNSNVPEGLFDLFSAVGQAAADHQFSWKSRFDSVSEKSAEAKFPIFVEDQARAKQKYADIVTHGSLKIPEGSNTQLISMVAGTMTVTTRNQRFFGVTANNRVDLHIIAVNTKLNEGQFVDFHDYSILVQEIVTTLLSPANKHEVNEIILPFFFAPEMRDKTNPAVKTKKMWKHAGA